MKASSNINVTVCAAAAVVMVVLLLGEANAACNPQELGVCGGAITSNTPPPPACCAKLKQQQPCLCQYLRNPALSPYVNSPGAKNVLSKCKVTLPKC